MDDAGNSLALKTTGLKKSFGSFRAVDDLDLSVKKGEIYGFLGRNGAGKTTTIRMLMGIIRSDGGTMEILGREVRRTSPALKRSLGYVSQEQHFYPWMTARSLGRFVGGFYPSWDPQEYVRLLSALDLPPERRVSALSHGMQIKLALALALGHRPQLLILDEPTSGLDPVARREFLEIVKTQSLAHGRTTFFSSHLVEEVERIAHRVGILHHGRLLYEGDIETLRCSVRRVKLPPPAVPPGGTEEGSPLPLPLDGFKLLREEPHAVQRSLILQAPPRVWESASFDPEEVEKLSLEDMFIAMVSEKVPQL